MLHDYQRMQVEKNFSIMSSLKSDAQVRVAGNTVEVLPTYLCGPPNLKQALR